MKPRVLVDLGLRTKSGPRLRAGLKDALPPEWRRRGWVLDILVPGEEDSQEFVLRADAGRILRQPVRSDLFLEEVWLPRLWRAYDVVITQRECVRRTVAAVPVVLQLHEHANTRYSPTPTVRAAARLALQRLRTTQSYGSAEHICFSSAWTRQEFLAREGRLPAGHTVVPLAGWPDGELTTADPPPPGMESEERPYVVAVASSDVRDDLGWGLNVWEAAGRPGELRVVGTAPAVAAPSVRFLGRVSDVELRSQLAGARAYLHLGRVEGFGLSIVEALQLGVPVLALSGSATDELLAEGGGCVVGDPESGGSALRGLLERADVAAEARRASARYRWSVTARGWADAVEQVLAGVA